MGFGIKALGFRIKDLRLRVGFRVEGLGGFRGQVWYASGFRIKGLASAKPRCDLHELMSILGLLTRGSLTVDIGVLSPLNYKRYSASASAGGARSTRI